MLLKHTGLSRFMAALTCAVVAITTPVAAQGAGDPAFTQFLKGLKPEAQAFGIGAAVFDRETASLLPDRTLPDLVLPGQTRAQGKQAEFSKTPLEYLDGPLLLKLATRGRDLARTHGPALARIEQELAVDRHVLLAIWGRETSFGQYRLPHDVIRVLATQAWLGRRKDLFKTELFHALKMIQDGVLDRRTMKASWAGAVGLVQFMPSEYDALAYDLDRDGKRDIWTSIPDALASAANQLKAKGWDNRLPWGFEAVWTEAGACLQEGPTRTRPLADWLALGVRRADGRPVPEALHQAPVFLLSPGGGHGPLFLVFENFLVLKRYNFADLYAVFVGHLADRIAGGGDFRGRWTTPKLLTNAEIEEVQATLQKAGYPIEKLDGKAGMNTRSNIGLYQKQSGLPVDCWPSPALLAHMRRTPTTARSQ